MPSAPRQVSVAAIVSGDDIDIDGLRLAGEEEQRWEVGSATLGRQGKVPRYLPYPKIHTQPTGLDWRRGTELRMYIALKC